MADGAVGDVVDVEPLVAQDDAEHLRQRQVVIDDQYATFHVGPFLSPAVPQVSDHPPTAVWEDPANGRGPSARANYAA